MPRPHPAVAPPRPRAAPEEATARPALLSVFLLGVLAVKLVVMFQLGGHPLLQPGGDPDAGYYVRLAQQVAGGDVLLGSRPYFVAPLYIYFVGGILALSGGSLLWVRVAQVLLGTLGVALIFAMTRCWYNRRAAWFGAVLAALTGLFTFYEALILHAALDPFLTALDLWVLARALSCGRAGWFVAAGATLGLHALNRPNLIVWPLVLCGLLLWRRGLGPVAKAGHVGALLAGLVIALAPPAVRTYVVAGEWSPLPSHGGLNFYIGNNAEADGTYHSVPGITPDVSGQAEDARRVAEAAVGRSLSDAEVSRYFSSLAWQWIRTHPAAALALFVRKVLYLLNDVSLTLNHSFAYYSRDEATLLRALVVGPWLLVPLGLVGLVVGARRVGVASASRGGDPAPSVRRTPYDCWVWCAFVPVYGLSVAAFFVASRYRVPLLVPLCAGAGAALDFLARAVAARAGLRRLGPVLAPVAALALVANWPLGLDDGRTEERTRMAVWLIGRGRDTEAAALVERIAPAHPQPGLFHFRLGQAYRARGRLDSATDQLRRALSADPRQLEVHLALGQVLFDRGQAAAAVPHLRAAFEGGLRRGVAGFDLARALVATGATEAATSVLAQVADVPGLGPADRAALGEFAFDLGALSLAERFFRQALAGTPGAAALHERLALVLVQAGRRAEAMRELERARRLDPTSKSARLNLAILYAEEGRLAEARASAEAALRLDPGYERARAFLAALNKR